MTPDFDVIIIGSGPSGVSAAFPLVSAGLKVLMLDGGRQARIDPPNQEFLSARSEDINQWKWMIGSNFHALKMKETVSPKLRVPTHDYVFEDFADENHIQSENFVSIGSLAKGGLSNTWGCGVAKLSDSKLSELPFPVAEMNRSYASVARRMGISGNANDDLADYFGVNDWAQPPVEMDPLHQWIFARYSKQKQKLASLEFRLGRSRVAAISEDFAGREACNLSGNCLWGCSRRALYSSIDQLPDLRTHPHFHEISGVVVHQINSQNNMVSVNGYDSNRAKNISFTGRKLILAAGSLASTRLVLQALQHRSPVPIFSAPTAAFLLWFPRFLGRKRMLTFGLGQLSFQMALQEGRSVFGSTFSTQGIPVSEFVTHLPMRRRNGIQLLSRLLSSCLVGNLFLSEDLYTGKATLQNDGSLYIAGDDNRSAVTGVIQEAARKIRKAYSKLGGVILPGSFTVGKPGGDIHYAGALPMREQPVMGETSADGEVYGLNGVYVVDGASFPILTEKSPTLTLMANADRIAHKIAGKF
ncbi:MAG: GMC oxidoreductase [Planctomycetota bacterium]